MDTVFDGCIVSIGGESFKASRAYDKLLLADADFILMKIRQHSLGDNIIIDLTCPSCSNRYKAELLVSEVKCYPIDDDVTKIEGGARAFNLKTANWDCVIRYPDRNDQRVLSKLSKDNPIEAMHQLYARIIVEIDGKTADGAELTKMIDSMPVKYIDELSEALENVLPGVESNHVSICPQCSQQVQMEVSGSDFLFAKSKGRTKEGSTIG